MGCGASAAAPTNRAPEQNGAKGAVADPAPPAAPAAAAAAAASAVPVPASTEPCEEWKGQGQKQERDQEEQKQEPQKPSLEPHAPAPPPSPAPAPAPEYLEGKEKEKQKDSGVDPVCAARPSPGASELAEPGPAPADKPAAAATEQESSEKPLAISPSTQASTPPRPWTGKSERSEAELVDLFDEREESVDKAVISEIEAMMLDMNVALTGASPKGQPKVQAMPPVMLENQSNAPIKGFSTDDELLMDTILGDLAPSTVPTTVA